MKYIELDSNDIRILVHLYHEGARSIEISGNTQDNRRRLQRMKRYGLCGCSPQQGRGGHSGAIWGITPAGVKAIEQSEMGHAGAWRENDFKMTFEVRQ